MLITKDNLPEIAAKVIFHGLSPMILKLSLMPVKCSNLVSNFEHRQLYNRFLLRLRTPTEDPEITDANMHEFLYKALNSEGNNIKISAKWECIQTIFSFLQPNFGSKEMDGLQNDLNVQMGYVDTGKLIGEMRTKIEALEIDTTFLGDENIEAYIAKIIEKTKEVLVSHYPAFKENERPDQTCRLL